MFFDSWTELLRIFAVGVPAYLSLVLVLRISGKRTLSKMNAFDFIVPVAMGSTLATIFLSREVSLSEGVVLETDGSITAVARDGGGRGSTLRGVRGR